MISIDEAKNVQFKKGVRGYNTEEVDNFVNEVVATLEQNKKEKIELVKKLDILAKRIEQYRKDEENVRGALINAEKVKGSAVKEAESKVSALLEEAKAEAKRIIYDANASVEGQKTSYLKLQADAVVLREQLLATYNHHIKMLEDLPTAVDIGQKKLELDKKYPTNNLTS
ncbi:MAG: DivIVA domain-containing protein, partial [Acutalibacteraceae bacterium]|nr:DivIVA domain-containing protein [Acutalibacteraceae bacterium]